jgi:hypothetical protein
MPKLLLLCLSLIVLLPFIVAAQDANEELLAAARKSDVEKVRALLAKGADVNAKSPYGATPLFFACDRGNAEVVRVLLENGADVNVRDKFYGATPLGWALGKGKPEIILLLIEKGAKETDQAMNFAINGNHVQVARAALAKGSFKQDALDKFLAAATRKGNSEIAELLKGAGAKPTAEFRVDAETLKLYEGAYKNENLTLTFKIKEGKLLVSATGFDSAMIPIRQHAFEIEQANGVTAIFNLEGDKVVSVTWKFTGGETVLKKGETK